MACGSLIKYTSWLACHVAISLTDKTKFAFHFQEVATAKDAYEEEVRRVKAVCCYAVLTLLHDFAIYLTWELLSV